MSVTEQLRAAVREIERHQIPNDGDLFRLKLHLMPPVGWLNDPNGLCQFLGEYHVFYQYAPFDARGGIKMWGHYVSRDLLAWERVEAPLLADCAYDKDGVYSGSAFTEDGTMYLYYTGNVKREHGDYVYTGREANTVLVTSPDGVHFSEKELLMTSADYPQGYSCHIRDPKVWKDGARYYMVQGGRKIGCAVQQGEATDIGTVLLFESADLRRWTFAAELTTAERFGYMWECPDYFVLDKVPVLSVCPQGVEAREHRFQNAHQSGYFLLKRELSQAAIKVRETVPGQAPWADDILPEAKTFCEWDMGFDFYAPQTFCDDKGRRILIGWAGVPDAEYDNEPTVQHGWQHALTIPRELTWKNGKILQNPVEEFKKLRGTGHNILPGGCNNVRLKAERPVFELEIDVAAVPFRLTVGTGQAAFSIEYDEEILRLALTEEAGRGRTNRSMCLAELNHLRVIVDTSMVEIFVNGGEAVLTSRFYFPDDEREIQIDGAASAHLWYLQGFEIM